MVHDSVFSDAPTRDQREHRACKYDMSMSLLFSVDSNGIVYLRDIVVIAVVVCSSSVFEYQYCQGFAVLKSRSKRMESLLTFRTYVKEGLLR